MNLFECIILGITSLRRNPLRTSLTILGIIVGVGSVVSMVSVGDGSRSMVLREIERTGGTKMVEIYKDDWDRQSGTLSRAAGEAVRGRSRWRRNRAEHLETEDAFEILKNARGIVNVVAEDDMPGWSVSFKGRKKESRIVASTAGYDRSYNWFTSSGRFFNADEVEAASSVAVIGSKIAEEVFLNEDPVGKEIKASRPSYWRGRSGLYEVRLKVIGVMEEKGDAMDTTGWDDRFIIPITTLQERFKGRNDVERIRVEAVDVDTIPLAIADAKQILGRIHNNTGEEYNYWTAQEELATADKVGLVMKALMGGIAGIALMVAGIGVMNIMLVSVTDRTQEIGLRKALGATFNDIITQFLIEASVLTLLGGVLGSILGVFMGQGTAALISKFVWEDSNWPSVISFETMFIALLVSVAIGVFFGLYPAHKAAKLTPVEALRTD
ncbi:MAG: ABC transporter permease [Candidatus Poribacteria bacterium]|nr:ABC transporter permease [Candidatus Poribacteria bacterium]